LALALRNNAWGFLPRAPQDLDIELWEASGTRLLGHCCVSVHPLLVKEQVTIDAALPLTSAGGLVVGTVRVHIEAS